MYTFVCYKISVVLRFPFSFEFVVSILIVYIVTLNSYLVAIYRILIIIEASVQVMVL